MLVKIDRSRPRGPGNQGSQYPKHDVGSLSSPSAPTLTRKMLATPNMGAAGDTTVMVSYRSFEHRLMQAAGLWPNKQKSISLHNVTISAMLTACETRSMRQCANPSPVGLGAGWRAKIFSHTARLVSNAGHVSAVHTGVRSTTSKNINASTSTRNGTIKTSPYKPK
jgi:hypothetical protein